MCKKYPIIVIFVEMELFCGIFAPIYLFFRSFLQQKDSLV